jgi:hypothetical protein
MEISLYPLLPAAIVLLARQLPSREGQSATVLVVLLKSGKYPNFPLLPIRLKTVRPPFALCHRIRRVTFYYRTFLRF